MKTAVYLRQSLDRHGDMLAVDRQREDCLKLCDQRGWTGVAEYLDNDVSASNGVRPDYQRMLDDVRAGQIERIVVWHADRLYRQLRELEDLIDLCNAHNVALATYSGDLDLSHDTGRMIARILGAVARGEVERKSARQVRAARQLAEQGRPWWSSRPFGYTPKGEVVPAEADLIRDAYAQVLAGASLHSIAAEWNRAGITTPKGGRWRGNGMHPLLVHPRNAGLRTYTHTEHGKPVTEIVGDAAWEPVVDRDVFEGVRAILTDPGRRHCPTAGRKYLLTALARCGACTQPLGSARTTRARAPVYVCKQKHCHGVSRSVARVDEFITGIVVERLSRPDAADLLIVEKRTDVNELRDKAAALRARQDEAAGMYADGTVNASQLRIMNMKLSAALTEIESKMLDANRTRVFDGVIGAPNPRWCSMGCRWTVGARSWICCSS